MSPLSRERWRAVSPYLDRALEMDGERRVAWVAAVALASPEVAEDLKTLLDEHDALREERFLENSPGLSLSLLLGGFRSLGADRV